MVFIAPFVFIVLQAFMTSQQALTSSSGADLAPRELRRGVHQGADADLPAQHLVYATLATAFMLLSSIPRRTPSRGCAGRRNVALRRRAHDDDVPPQVTQVPIYVMWTNLHLTGTLWLMILPNLLGDAFSIFLLRQFFLTIRRSTRRRARRRVLRVAGHDEGDPADGQAGHRCHRDVHVLLLLERLLRPAALHQREPGNWTISLGLASFRNLYQVQWNLTMAATLLAMLPVLVVFFLAQKVRRGNHPDGCEGMTVKLAGGRRRFDVHARSSWTAWRLGARSPSTIWCCSTRTPSGFAVVAQLRAADPRPARRHDAADG